MPMPLRGTYFDCVYCSKPIYRTPGDARKAPLGKFKCSKQCYSPKLPEKRRARNMLNHALKSGKIVALSGCGRCGSSKNIQAHHSDYSKPLDVEWICRACHDIEHYKYRVKLVESRRKHFEPCACGQKAICRNKCAGCYMKWLANQPANSCRFPKCKSKSHARGLCNKHRQQKEAVKKFGLKRKKPGPKH